MKGGGRGARLERLEGIRYRAGADRFWAEVGGRDPAAMLKGLVSGRLPSIPESRKDEGDMTPVDEGVAEPSILLTPKGRMIADLRLLRVDGGDDPLFLLDLPAVARDAVVTHLSRFLPPRMARFGERPDIVSVLLFGEGVAEWLSREPLGFRIDPETLQALPPGRWIRLGAGDEAITLFRRVDLGPAVFELMAERDLAQAVLTGASEAGAHPMDPELERRWRIETGTPAWGAELDETVIPTEAGMDRTHIDHGKGCYTGQEVIVRIRDRGHVNRHLRRLRGSGSEHAVPEVGTELLPPDGERAMGKITSVVETPGGIVALGFVRREISPGTDLRISGDDRLRLTVEALDGTPD